MSDRVHQFLDGDLAIEQLTAEERTLARRLERTQGLVVNRLCATPAPDLVKSVLQRVEEIGLPPSTGEPDSWIRRFARWAWAPRPVQLNLRPALLLPLALLVLALIPPLRAAFERGPEVASVTTAPEPTLMVQFRLEAPGAREVSLAGSFTDWQPTLEMYQTTPGIWSIVVPLDPGVYDYTFVVDGTRWVPDPHAPQIPDNFGGTNSRLTLLAPNEAA